MKFSLFLLVLVCFLFPSVSGIRGRNAAVRPSSSSSSPSLQSRIPLKNLDGDDNNVPFSNLQNSKSEFSSSSSASSAASSSSQSMDFGAKTHPLNGIRRHGADENLFRDPRQIPLLKSPLSSSQIRDFNVKSSSNAPTKVKRSSSESNSVASIRRTCMTPSGSNVSVSLQEVDAPIRYLQWGSEQLGLVFILTRNGTVYRSLDRGASFTPLNTDRSRMNTPANVTVRVRYIFHSADPLFYWFVSLDGYWTTRDGGETFQFFYFSNVDSTISPNDNRLEFFDLVVHPHFGNVALVSAATYYCAYCRSSTNTNTSGSHLSTFITNDYGVTWRVAAEYIEPLSVNWAYSTNQSLYDTILVMSTTLHSGNQPFSPVTFSSCSHTNLCIIESISLNLTANFADSSVDIRRQELILFRTGVGFMQNVLSGIMLASFDVTKPYTVFSLIRNPEEGYAYELWYSLDTGNSWTKCIFPEEVYGFFGVVDSDENTIMITTGRFNPNQAQYLRLTTATLWVTDFTSGGRMYKVLENVRGYFGLDLIARAEITQAESVKGLYLANVVTGSTSNCTQSWITYNNGGAWQRLIAPPAICPPDQPNNCYLNLYGYTSQHNPPYAVPGAPGVMLAFGAGGSCLPPSPSEVGYSLISNDFGLNWKILSNETTIYEVGNYGGIILSAFDSIRSHSFNYTLDFTKSWTTCDFAPEISDGFDTFASNVSIVDNILPNVYHREGLVDFNALSFIMYGQRYSEDDEDSSVLPPGFVGQIDFSSSFSRVCNGPDRPDTEGSDYALISAASNLADPNRDGCVLGRKPLYLRRLSSTLCSEPLNLSLELRSRELPCPCTEEDFICDFCFQRQSPMGPGAVLDDESANSVPPTINGGNTGAIAPFSNPCVSMTNCSYSASSACKKANTVTYNISSGYFLIPASLCNPAASTSISHPSKPVACPVFYNDSCTLGCVDCVVNPNCVWCAQVASKADSNPVDFSPAKSQCFKSSTCPTGGGDMVRWLEAKLPTQCLSSAGKCSPDQLNSCDQACDPFPVVKCVCGLSSKGMMTASPECKVVVAVRKSAPGLSGGSIAGITIGVIILVILIVGPIIACWVFPSLRKYAPCAKIRDSDGYFQVDRDRKRGGSKNSKSNYRKFENAESPPDDEI